jgi:hypothetical protein
MNFLKTIDMKSISMRIIFSALVNELGSTEGRSVFEWYCQTYNVTITDEAPSRVAFEVLGI